MNGHVWTPTGKRWQAAAWLLLALGIAAFFAGQFAGWANQFGWFDEALHTYNSAALALLLAVLVGHRMFAGVPDHRVLKVACIVALTLAAGFVWELAEWAYDSIRAPNVILGKDDTLIDLVCDTAGGLLGALVGLPVLARADRRERP